MEIIKTIDTITDWINKNVCPKVQLKEPLDANVDPEKGYDVRKVNPTAFSLFAPTKEKLPPRIKSEVPSVVVQIIEGSDRMTSHNRRLKLQLSFLAWNPGKAREEGATKYSRDLDGWKDVWAFLERTISEIENAEYMDDVRLVKEESITFGQFQTEGQISDLYPYWGAWAIFTVETAISRSGKAYQNYL